MSYQKKQLGDVARIVRGVTFRPTDVISKDDENAVVCFRTKNIQQKLDESDLLAIPQELVKREDQFVISGDILVSSANSWNLVGKCCYVSDLNYEATAGGFISILRGIDLKVNSRYLYHWFSSPNIQALLRSFGRQTTNISNLNINLTLQTQLPLPSLLEQKRIAEVLDKADALREKRRLALQKLDMLLHSIFVEIFGEPLSNTKNWQLIKLEEIAKRVVVGHVGPTSHGYTKDGIPFLRTQNVRPLRINRLEMQYITPEFHSGLRKSTIKSGDVLISRVGANRGMSAVVPDDLDGANCANIIIITPGKLIKSDYLSYLVNSSYGQKSLLGVSVGSAQGVINTGAVKKWNVLLPPIELQTRFSKFINKLEDLKEKHYRALELAENLFESLQQRAFKGELFSEEPPAAMPQEENEWRQTSLF